MDAYSDAVCEKMRRLYSWLSEKDRRRYAAIEAEKLGRGGTEFVSKLFGCDPKTIRQGMTELEGEVDPAADRVRQKGGDVGS